MSELPNEIRAKPAVLVGLSGLDISNPVHRSIWDVFNNRRPDGSPVHYKLLNNNQEFPTVKPKVRKIDNFLKIIQFSTYHISLKKYDFFNKKNYS